ncbi:hypothetical protein [Piscinibacter sp. HJYY11]|uniref:hypothetical protein n=1 Tax=Piscinibacter sp. HJYY11 TaxID=2801333 RepID=UPI00191D315B|nr:hypothetical protein [Piscinibacter sp. HJYY11]MBL0730275.1 hypothetical protein [Piscinibacter sp. HJYY11]
MEEFLVAGVSRADQPSVLVIADPAQPLPPVLTTTADSILEVSNVTFDATQRRATWGNATAVYYVNNRQLHQASLRKSLSPRTQRISSLTAACSVDNWYPFSYSTGDDGWVEVTEAGPDANCTTAADNRKAFVRNSSPQTTDATTLPSGVRVLMALPDPANNALVGFIASDTRATPSKLALYSPTLTYVSDVVGGTGLSDLEFMSLLPGTQLTSSAFVKFSYLLLRLTWSSTSASLSATGQRLTVATSGPQSYFNDGSAMYFVDGLAIKSINAGGTVSTLATLASADGTTARLKGLTSDHVVVQQEATNGSTQAFTIPKGGGTPFRLAPANWVASVIGLSGDEVIYATKPGYAITPAFRRIRADGGNERQINLGYSTHETNLVTVYSPTIPYLSAQVLDAVIWCEGPMGVSGCPGNGVVRSYDIETGAITTMGNLSLGRGGLIVRGSGFTGRPTVITTIAGFTAEFYLVQSNAANSLVRLTNYIP